MIVPGASLTYPDRLFDTPAFEHRQLNFKIYDRLDKGDAISPALWPAA